MSLILLHQKYYLAVLQASELACKDAVMCSTLKFKRPRNKCTASFKAEKELYLKKYERNKSLTQAKLQK